MKRFGTFFGFSCGLLAVVACSAGSSGTSTGISGGDGGSSASGGSGVGGISAGGSSATGAGGTSTGGTGGSIVVAGSSGDTSGSAGSGMVCNPLTAMSTVLVPTVLILVDNSSSMFETTSGGTTAWKLLYDALMDPTTGAVKPLEDSIRFGFASYKGHQGTSEEDPACATITPATPTFSTGSYAAIDAVYGPLGSEVNNGAKWETPTGHAIAAVTPDLVAFTADPPGPKYILLVTDGNPNTCKTLDPQCGQDRTIKAVQDSFAEGIGTFVIGIGDIVAQPNNGCTASSMRCGNEHLQDVANAGAGLPVTAPPDNYKYEGCVANEGGVLTASYAAAGETAGTAPYFATNNGEELRMHLADLLNGVQSCTFDLDAVVTGNAALGDVSLDGTRLTYGDTAAGWSLEDNKYQVTLQGSACDTYRSGAGHTVAVSFPCDMGKPIAEPR